MGKSENKLKDAVTEIVTAEVFFIGISCLLLLNRRKEAVSS